MNRVVVVSLFLFLLSANSQATLIPAGANDADYLNLGSAFAGRALWIRGTRSDGTTFYGSAVRLNSNFALTAAHNIWQPEGNATVLEVGTGTNYLSNPGDTRAVVDVHSHEDYVADPWKFQFKFTPDIAILKFDEPLPGTDLTIGERLTKYVDVAQSAGYGRHGDTTTGYLPQDGFIRGYQGIITDSVNFNISGDLYSAIDFQNFSQGLPLNGNGSPGDSGSPAFDINGNLIGLVVASSNDGHDPTSKTIYLRVTDSSVRNWITANVVLNPGDFNSDQIVDAADYVVWRKQGGTTESYNVWRQHYGESYLTIASVSVAVVPEPTTLLSALFVVGGMAVTERRIRI